MAVKKYRGLGRLLRGTPAVRLGRARKVSSRLSRFVLFKFLRRRRGRKPKGKPLEQVLAEAIGKAMADALAKIEEKKKVESETKGELTLKQEKAETDFSKLATVPLGAGAEEKAAGDAWRQDDLTKIDRKSVV